MIMQGSMKIANYNRCYAYLLLVGAAYFLVSLILNYDAAYVAWQNWTHPEYSIKTYPLLFISYFLDLGAPLVMIVVGINILKRSPIKKYVILLLIIFLFLAKIIGQVILLGKMRLSPST